MRAGSPLNGKIAVDKVAAMGTSCGGFLSIALGADARVKSIGVFNSGIQTPPAGQAAHRGAVVLAGNRMQTRSPNCTDQFLLLNGGEPDFLIRGRQSGDV